MSLLGNMKWFAALAVLGTGCSLLKLNGKPIGGGGSGGGESGAVSGSAGGAASQVNTASTPDGRPGWCKDYNISSSMNYTPADFDAMKDPKGYTDNLIGAVAEVTCATSGDTIGERDQILAIRDAWMKRESMDEIDFAAVVATSKGYGWDSQELASMPRPFSDVVVAYPSQLMVALDQQGARASQLGKHNLVSTCFQTSLNNGEIKDVGLLLEILCTRVTLDATKAYAEIDSAQDLNPSTRYQLRRMVHLANVAWKNASTDVAAKAKADPGIAKLVAIADEAKQEWASLSPARAKLVEQVSTLEDAMLSNKRSAFAGCEETTRAAWTAHVKTLKVPKVPSSTQHLLDGIVPIAFADADAYLAWQALSLCAAGLDKPLVRGFEFVGSDVIRRGMFTSTIASWLAASGEIKFDDRSLQMGQLFQGTHDQALPMTEGARFMRIVSGQIDTVTPNEQDGTTRVTFKRVTTKMDDCVKSQETNRISNIDRNGDVHYEHICLQWAKVTVDITAAPISISSVIAVGLKPGMYLHTLPDGFPIVATAGSSKAAWLMGVTL